MDSPAPPAKWPLVYLLALTAAASGLMVFLLVTVLADQYQRGLQLLAAAVFCAGLGEVYNHPRQQRLDPRTSEPEESFHRRRNPCALGNLLLIASLLLLFMAIATVLPQR